MRTCRCGNAAAWTHLPQTRSFRSLRMWAVLPLKILHAHPESICRSATTFNADADFQVPNTAGGECREGERLGVWEGCALKHNCHDSDQAFRVVRVCCGCPESEPPALLKMAAQSCFSTRSQADGRQWRGGVALLCSRGAFSHVSACTRRTSVLRGTADALLVAASYGSLWALLLPATAPAPAA